MFIGVFQDGLKEGHFNKSIAQSLSSLLAEMVTREEWYIQGEENTAEKKASDTKYCNTKGSHHPHKNIYT